MSKRCSATVLKKAEKIWADRFAEVFAERGPGTGRNQKERAKRAASIADGAAGLFLYQKGCATGVTMRASGGMHPALFQRMFRPGGR